LVEDWTPQTPEENWTPQTPEPEVSVSRVPPVTWLILLLLALAAVRGETGLEDRLEYLSKFALTTKEAVATVRNSVANIQSLAVTSRRMRDVF